jgi:site-specific DNA-methyltransferase (adenine-specific)
VLANSIICGDSSALLKDMPSESVDMILTDMPYGIAYKSNKQNYDTRGDAPVSKDRDEYFEQIQGDEELPTSWLTDAYRVLKDNSAIYVFAHWSKWHILYPAVCDAGFVPKNMIVLNKSNHGMGDLRGSFAPMHELILFAAKGRHILNFRAKRLNDVWDVPVRYSRARRYHPNEKPISWLTPCIESSTKRGDIVLDPFAGSGSTGVACKQLGRKYVLMDIEQKYCDIACDRIANSSDLDSDDLFVEEINERPA